MFPDMHHGICLKDFLDPAVVGEILMSRHQVRAVEDSQGVIPVAPGGLETDKDIAELQARNCQCSIGTQHFPWRFPPILPQLALDLRRKSGKPFGVTRLFHMASGMWPLDLP